MKERGETGIGIEKDKRKHNVSDAEQGVQMGVEKEEDKNPHGSL